MKRLLSLALLGLLAAPGTGQLTLSLSQQLYQGGDALAITLTGTPGHLPILLANVDAGPTVVPGLGSFDIGLVPSPIVLPLAPIAASGQAQLTCALGCSTPLIGIPMYVQAVAVDPFFKQVDISNSDAINTVAGDCGQCVRPAIGDSYAKFGSGHALWLPGLATDFVFVSGGDLVERNDGTARLLGVLESASNPGWKFVCDVTYTGLVAPTDVGCPPAGSPKKELDSTAYVESGGPVNSATWRYYTGCDGSLLGLESFAGALIDIDARGAAFQVGWGASGKNVGYGASGWLTATTLQQPLSGAPFASSQTGDFNLDLGGDCVNCADEWMVGDHSFAMPGIAVDMEFITGGRFVERSDGTAQLTGTVASVGDSLKAFDVVVDFSDRVDPGALGYPPSGSPKKELSASQYSDGGGVIDAALWHYYQTLNGVMTGRDDYAGASVTLVRMGPSMQVGLGANGKTAEYGASSWLIVTIAQQPTTGAALSTTGQGDINIGLEGICP